MGVNIDFVVEAIFISIKTDNVENYKAIQKYIKVTK